MLLRLAYDGTDFSGFAVQNRPNEYVRTVQGVLERALSQLYKQPMSIRGASRTDSGVHAHGQIVAFDPPFDIPPKGVLLALAANLPEDLIAAAAWPAEDLDHRPLNPRFHTLGKCYCYRIRNTPLRDPIGARFEWHLIRSVDHSGLEPLRAAAQMMVGTHDFAGFRAGDCQATSTRRRIHGIEIRTLPARTASPLGTSALGGLADPDDLGVIEIEIRGDAFLKYMVRIMVGTMVDVARGRFGLDRVAEVLRTGERARAGATAPARGLTLVEVLWPRQWPPPPRGNPTATP